VNGGPQLHPTARCSSIINNH